MLWKRSEFEAGRSTDLPGSKIDSVFLLRLEDGRG